MDPELEQLIRKQLGGINLLGPMAFNVLEILQSTDGPVGLLNLAQTSIKKPSRMVETVDLVNLRAGPNGKVLKRVESGMHLIVTTRLPEWLLVVDPEGILGVISNRYVKEIDGLPQDDAAKLGILESTMQGLNNMGLIVIEEMPTIEGGWSACLTRKGRYLTEVIFHPADSDEEPMVKG